MPHGTTPPIGGSIVEAGGTITANFTLTGATTSMSVAISPVTFPGEGIVWQAFVSAADTVTVKISKILAGLIPAVAYIVVATDGSGGGGTLTLQTNGTPNGSQSLLDLQQGSNITLTDNGSGQVTIDGASPGTGTVTHTGTLTANAPVFGNGGADVKVGTKTGNDNIVVTAETLDPLNQNVPLLYDANGNVVSTATRSGNTTAFATISGAQTQNVPLLYDTSGNIVATATRSGNTTTFVTTTGTLPSGDIASWDASGNAIDSTATVAALAQKILTTKGDLLAFASALARVAVGADGTVLTADSTQTAGIKWAAAGGSGALTLIQKQTLGAPAATITFSAIPNTFSALVIMLNLTSTTQNDGVYAQANTDTGSNYANVFYSLSAATISAGVGQSGTPTQVFIAVPGFSTAIGGIAGASMVTIPGYALTIPIKTALFQASASQGNASFTPLQFSGSWMWKATAAINQLIFGLKSGGNFQTGDVIALYGTA